MKESLSKRLDLKKKKLFCLFFRFCVFVFFLNWIINQKTLRFWVYYTTNMETFYVSIA